MSILGEEHIFPRKWVIPVADGKFVQFRAIPPSCRRFVRGWKALDLCNLFTFYLVVYVRYMGYEEGVEVRPAPRRRVPFCTANSSTKRVLEYARLAMGFAHARASRYGIR